MANNNDDWQEVPLEPTRAPAVVPTDDWQEQPVAAAQATHDDWQELPALKEERGAVGQAWDKYVQAGATGEKGLGKAVDYVKNEASQLADTIGGLGSAIHADTLIEGAKAGVNAAWRGLDTAMTASNRIGGTVVASVVSPVARVLHLDSLDLMEKGRLREAQLGTKANSFDDLFPVRLLEDVGMPIGQNSTDEFGKYLQSFDSKTMKEIGEVVRGFAPGMGIATGLAASFYLDPISMTKVGTLTEAGIEAEKAGTLGKGVAQQMAMGQRSAVELRIGNTSLGITNFGKIGEDKIARASKAMTLAELAEYKIPFTGATFKPMQTLRKFTTMGPFEDINLAREQRLMAEDGIHYTQEQFFQQTWGKAQSLGIDIEAPAVREDLYSYFENPSSYKGKLDADAASQVFNHLDSSLQKEVQLTREAGIEVFEKTFKPGQLQNEINELQALKNPSAFAERSVLDLQKQMREVIQSGEFSERYVPRGAMPSKRQALEISKEFKDGDKAAEFIAGLEEGGRGRMGGSNSFQKFRDLKSRSAMNNFIKEQTGIESYFHDDIVLAYGEKITELQRARMDKKFVSTLVDKFGTTDAEFIDKVNEAKIRVEAASQYGLPANPDDILMANLKSSSVQRSGLSEGARARLRSIAKISPDIRGAENLKVPGFVADYVGEVLYRPQMTGVAATLLSYQNALKGFMFFNPGFHIRNQYENTVRGLAVGVGATENAKAFAGMVAREGPWADRLPLFLERTRAIGLATPLEEGIETALGQRKLAAKIRFDNEMLKGNTVMQRLWGPIREMGSTGQWKQFIKDLRDKGPAAVGQNPLFRFSSMLGAKAEAIPKFGYFNKLIDEGYNADTAIRKVNSVFMNYENTRGAVRKVQLLLPFSNYMIKNAESTLAILAMNPRNAAIFGPSGAFQRAIENWSDWDPERTWKMKEQMGVWANDVTLLPVMPGQADIDKQQDLIKKTMFKWFSMNKTLPDGTKINETEGAMLWMKLPSNYHALQTLNPAKVSELKGPMVGAVLALVGIDPFTGEPFRTPKHMDIADIIGKATDQFKGIVWPDRAIKGAQMAFQQLLPDYEKHCANLGLPDSTAKFLFGTDDPTDPRRKKMIKSLSWMKSMASGGATQMDYDLDFRVKAKLRTMQDFAKEAMSSKDPDPATREKILRQYDRMNSELKEIMDVKADYDDAVKRMKIAPTSELDWKEMLDEKSDSQPLPPSRNPAAMDWAVDEALKPKEGGLNESSSILNSSVIRGGPTLTDRASELTQKYMQSQMPQDLSASTEGPNPGDEPLEPNTLDRLMRTDDDQGNPIFNKDDEETLRNSGISVLESQVQDEMDSIIDPGVFQNAENQTDSNVEAVLDEAVNKLSPEDRATYEALEKKLSALQGHMGDQ